MKIKPYMEDFIINNYMTMTQKELAEHLGEGITASNIQYWLRKKNLWKEKYMFSDDRLKYMIENYRDMEYSEIAKHVGLTERQVRGKLNNMGYTKNREFNQDYFDKIDSCLKAYFLGFIFADGWIVHSPEKHNYEFGMQLQSCDKYVLELLNDELGGVHIISHNDPTTRIIGGVKADIHDSDTLRVYSKKIVEDLIRCGITPRKTYNYEIPKFDMKYFFDFLRGYIDGDGCYYYNRYGVNMSLVCADENVLKWIQSILKQYNITTSIYKEKQYKYRLSCFNKTDMQTLINLLYYDEQVFCLKRKYNKISPLLMPSQSEMVG